MRVKNVKIHNVMRIRDLDVDLADHSLALVGGKNAQGKTSALSALLMTLCGKRGMNYPDVPLKEGENEAECVIRLATATDGSDNDVFPDMTEVTVTRRWERRRDGSVKETLSITDEEGQKSASPQEILNSLFKSRAFNPLSLAQAAPKEQRRMLMDLVGLTDEFDQLDAEYQSAYAERALVNQQGVAAKAAFDRLEFIADAPEAEVSIGTLLDELKVTDEQNDQVRETQLYATVVAEEVKKSKELIERKKSELKAAKKALAEAEAKLKVCEERSSELSFVETDTIRARIDRVEDENAMVRSNQRYNEAEAELESLRKVRSDWQAKVEAIPRQQNELLANADWPIDELSIDDEGVLYRGLPESQASLAERIRLWCRVAAALNPKLPLLVFHDGNALDYASMDELDLFLEESGFQAIVEFVTRNAEDEDRCVVVIEDGQALAQEVA
jgi:predicted ATP-dependent endonuclease of OLD family